MSEMILATDCRKDLESFKKQYTEDKKLQKELQQQLEALASSKLSQLIENMSTESLGLLKNIQEIQNQMGFLREKNDEHRKEASRKIVQVYRELEKMQ